MSELISPTRPHAMQWLVGRWHEAGMLSLSLSLSLSLVTLRQVATYMRKSLQERSSRVTKDQVPPHQGAPRGAKAAAARADDATVASGMRG